MLSSWIKWGQRESMRAYPQVETYQTVSTASVDALWQRIINLADVSWHPLIVSTNVPKGLIPKPGLIYQAVSRFLPFRINIFVERVQPRELLSVRIIALPGVEERVTYRVESTLCGTRVSYSVTLRGWLSPLVWSLIRPYAARVAAELAQAAEQDYNTTAPQRKTQSSFSDLLGWAILLVGSGYGWATLPLS